MIRWYKDIKRRLLTKVDAHGLAVFRMFYVLVLFSELSQLKKFSQIIYNEAPFLAQLEFSSIAVFVFWQVILIFLFFGLFTRITTIINYIFSILVFSFLKEFEYHVFYAYVGINFFLLFMPVSRVLSLDSLIEKIKYSSVGKFYKPDPKVFALNYFIPVFVGVGIVYFDSMFYKIESSMWKAGLGMWLPANIPQATWTNLTFLMNNEFLVRFMGYLVMVFETVFIFLMWYRTFRIPFFILGIFFHIGILICYPIPWFALTAIAIYLLMLPAGMWKHFNLKVKRPKFTFYFDYECPLCIKTVVFIEHLDIFGFIECKSVQGYYATDPVVQNIPMDQMFLEIYSVDRRSNKIYKGYDTYIQLLINMRYTLVLGYIMKLPFISKIGRNIYNKVAKERGVYRCTKETCNLPVLNESIKNDEPILVSWITKDAIIKVFWKYTLILIMIVQVINSLFSKYPDRLRHKIPNAEKANAIFVRVSDPIRNCGKVFLGLTNHPVFMDRHFKNYNHIFKVTYKEKGNKEVILPIINNEGMPDSYIRGAFWVNYSFRVNNPDFRIEEFNAGMKRYILYWLKENERDLKANHNFNVYVKEIEIPTTWKKDFLNTQIAKPWKPCGLINMNNGILTSSIDSLIQ